MIVGLLHYVGRHRGWALSTVFFGVAGFMLSFAYPSIIGSAVDLAAGPARNAGRLTFLAELAVATALAHAIVVYGRGHSNVHLGHGVVCDIRRALFDHLQRLSVHFFSNERTGSMLSHVLHDVHEATALIYTGVIVVALDAVQLVIAVALMTAVSAKLTLACVGLFPFYALVFVSMNPRVRRASERMNDAFHRIAGNLGERLAGQALVKTYNAEARESKRFAEEVRGHHELVVAQSHNGHVVAAAGEVLVHLGTTLVIGYGGWLALRGELTPGGMTRFLGFMLIMFGPLRRFAELNITYQSSLSAMRRVFGVLDIQPTIVETSRPRRKPPAEGHVILEDVHFRYDAEPVLKGISMEARPGERIAIVGPSGAGKTTLVSLIPRLHDVGSGRVLVDGTDVREYSFSALRSAIAIVQQDSFVFSGSIRDNIAYGRPDASDDEIRAAAVAANAHEFIERLPDGYASRLGERGVNLSGGQRQRLSIARAVLKNPRILLLDEATSSLDTESEAIVQRALEALMRARTCFVVAHRLSTIKNADRIIVLDGGAVAEQGTHAELLDRGGVYARLVRHQR
jgi:subfamily B ATP-binding cassette protein MsbA